VPLLDTTVEAASVQTEAQRRLGVAGRLRTAVEMSELTRKLARAGLRGRRPDLNDRQVDQELLLQLYGFKPLLKLLPDTEYYVSDEAALDTLARRSQFNVVDFATGWKVDFIIAKDREFSRTEFERRRLLELDGLTLYFASPEDVLISGSICRHRASGTSANLASTNRCRSHSIHSFKRF
jgi:hypothetical protein